MIQYRNDCPSTRVLEGLEALKETPTHKQLQFLAGGLQELLQNGLVGNRAVSRGDVWGVITAGTRAFPIQLSPSVEKSQELVQAGAADASLLQTWITQAIADGSLVILLQKLRSQPQILTAYARDAAIRQPAAADQLVAALQNLQGLIPISPYDAYLQAKASAPAAAPAQPPVHIETEQDLLHPQQQQQQQSPLPSPASSSAGSKAGTSSSGTSSSGTSSSGTSSSGDQASGSSTSYASSSQLEGLPPTVPLQQQQQQPKQQGLVDRLRSARLPQIGSFSRKAAPQQSQQQQQQQTEDLPVLQLQITVTQTGPLDSTPEKLVQVHIQAVSPHTHHQQQQQQQRPAKGKWSAVSPRNAGPAHQDSSKTSDNSSSSTKQEQVAAALPNKLQLGGESVKGLLQGLQQTATSGLQQSAAAGQELSGAVAAAGGAVAAALSSPFVAVQGFNRFRSGKKHTAAAAAGGGHGATPQAGSSQTMPAAQPPSTAGAAGSATAQEPHHHSSMSASPAIVLVQLEVLSVQEAAAGADGSSCGPLKLHLRVVEAAAAAAAAAAVPEQQPAAEVREGWSTRALRDRLRLTRGSASSSSSSQQQEVHDAGTTAATASGTTQQQQQQQGAEDVLEGDMWSVMSRLRSASNMLAPRAAAAAAAEGPAGSQQQATPTAAGPAPEAAAAAELQESGCVLQQRLISCCEAVCGAAAGTKDCLGEESSNLLELIDLLKGLLNHGLNSSSSSSTAGPAAASSSSNSRGSTPEPGSSSGNASSSVVAVVKAAATAREMLGGLLHGRQQSAFGVLQALQHGSKQQPRLMLGADGIANMKAAKAAPSAAKLDLWLRASLNEQLLGVRISALLSNPSSLRAWYHPQALLLQHTAMTAVMQQLQELSQFKFALPVELRLTATARDGGASAATAAAAPESPAAAAAAAAGDESSAAAAGGGKGSAVAAALDPRRFLGGFSVGLGPLRVGSQSSQPTEQQQQQLPSAAAAAVPGPSANSSSSSSIPTFFWGTAGSQNPAPAPVAAAAGSDDTAAAAAASTAATGGFFRRRRVVQIKEVRVPAAGSGPVLSREPSSTLSPMSTEGDAAYAEWWSPNNSSQDLSAAVAAAAAGENSSSSGGGGTGGSASARRLGSSSSLRSLGSSKASGQGLDVLLGEGSSGTPRSAAAAAGVLRSSSRHSRASESEVSTGVTSEAALKLELNLQAAMSAPLLAEQLSTRSRSSGSGSEPEAAAAAAALRRQHSAGWDAAVAAARARSRGPSLTGAGSGLHAGALAALSRRSRSPEPQSGRQGGLSEGGVGVGSGSGRRPRHMHKRSSSLNDLPELEALWMDGSR